MNHPYAPTKRSYRKTRFPFTRAQVVKAVRSEQQFRDWLAERREKLMPTPVHKRIANVRVISGGGVRVVGYGELPFSGKELRTFLKFRGFTGQRRGGLVFSV